MVEVVELQLMAMLEDGEELQLSGHMTQQLENWYPQNLWEAC